MNQSDPTTPAPSRKRSRIWAAGLLAIFLGIAVVLVAYFRPREGATIPFFTVPIGQVRPPLPYRIVSFHRARFDKNLIRLASQLGFNGVQFQIEGSNEAGIKDFAQRNAREHIVDFCHALHMKVTVWVHEISDLPTDTAPDYLGDVTVDNERIWDVIDKRYDWILGSALPNIDGLVLTCVETQHNSTDAGVMNKLVTLIDQKCRHYGKELTVRTFVWHPNELDGVMATVKKMPRDIVIMSKVVPQDWQMRGGNAAEIGAVGEHPQIVEYDAAGEYFLSDNVANCMVDQLKQQFDYGLSKNVQGICVRVDRYDASVLWEPNEVNLWALGLLASGVTDNTDDIWKRWAAYRYGEKAAPAVITALKPTSDVIAEMLSVGPFTNGDTRGPNINGKPSYYVPLPYGENFSQNWQMWRWNLSYVPALTKVTFGDPLMIDTLRKQQAAALEKAKKCLQDLEQAKTLLPEKEYQILYTKLLTNKVQLEFRSQAIMATMHYRQMIAARTQPQYDNAYELYKSDLAAVQKVADALCAYPKPGAFDYLDKKWQVNYPLAVSPGEIDDWLALAAVIPEEPATNP